MPVKKAPELGSEQALTLVSSQWFILVVHALMGGKRRYSEVQRAIPTVSKKMLTQTLRGMERDGFVTRTVFPVVPPRTEYALTELGQSLVPHLQQLCRWSTTHFELVQLHRKQFDEKLAAESSKEAT